MCICRCCCCCRCHVCMLSVPIQCAHLLLPMKCYIDTVVDYRVCVSVSLSLCVCFAPLYITCRFVSLFFVCLFASPFMLFVAHMIHLAKRIKTHSYMKRSARCLNVCVVASIVVLLKHMCVDETIHILTLPCMQQCFSSTQCMVLMQRSTCATPIVTCICVSNGNLCIQFNWHLTHSELD